MALMRGALDRLTDTSVRAAWNEQAYSSNIRPALKAIRHTNPYALTPEAADKLETLGIGTDPTSCTFHTHAAAKAIENELLVTVGRMLPEEPATILFMKKSKLQQMRRSPKRCIFHNQILQPRDVQRFDPDTLVKDYCVIDTKYAYMSDTLHFLKPELIASIFAQSPTLQHLLATIVLPPEAKHKHPSVMPEVYSINYHGSGFQYVPGDHGGAAYHHEFHQLQWLSLGKFHYNDVVVTVEMIESKGANHLFMLSRGDLLTPRVRTFHKNDLVLLPQIFLPPDANARQPIPKTFAMKMLFYVRSIKKVTMQDVWAKMRQVIPSSLLDRWSPTTLTHVANYFFFIGNKDCINSHESILAWPKWLHPLLNCKSTLVNAVRKLAGNSQFEQFLLALDWQEFSYSEEVTTLDLNWAYREESKPLDFGPPAPADDEEDEVEHSTQEKKAVGRTAPQAQSTAPAPSGKEVETTGAEEEATDDLPWTLWLKVLQAAGFKGKERQYDPAQELILPVKDVRSQHEATADVDPELAQLFRGLKRKFVMAPYSSTRGAAYASDVKNSRVGALLREQGKDWKAGFSFKAEQEDRFVPTLVIHGAGGSGKSFALQEFLRSKGAGCQGYCVIVPTVELLQDWRNKVPNLDVRSIRTFEKALMLPFPRVCIFDDYGKLPAGYLEATVLNHPSIENIILTGDPRQSVHHENNDQAHSAHISPAIDVFQAYSNYYLNATHRNVKFVANALGVYSEKNSDAVITCGSKILEGWPLLVPSQVKKVSYGDMGRKAYTYTGCQGLTTPKVQILLDRDTTVCSERAFYTALSRAESHIHFVNTGPNSNDYWDKLNSTPFLKTFLELARAEAIAKAHPVEEPVPCEDPKPPTHFPVTNPTHLLSELTEALEDKQDRELYRESSGHSNCIQTQDPVVQLFQHQQAKDETLMDCTMKKRVLTSTTEANEAEFYAKRDLGDILFHNYASAMGLTGEYKPFDQDLWDACKAEVQETYLKKPLHMLMNAHKRQDPDFGWNKIDLFLKSQWVTKVDKIGALKVKEGQTIASFFQQTVMIFGTMARYMRRMRDSSCPSKILINCEKNPSQLDQFLKENWSFVHPASTNDFTAFDQSQDGAMLQFEIMKAKYYRVPEDIIDAYYTIKTQALIYKGTLQIMRLTGEGPTFDANTECNIAFQHTKYLISPGTTQLYAGDDSALDSMSPLKPSFKYIQHRFSLVSKEKTFQQARGDWAEFCGWLITPHGLIKDPLKLHASLELKLRTARSREFLDSFRTDAERAYSLGDCLQDVLTESQCEMHQATIRTLVLEGKAPRGFQVGKPNADSSTYLGSPLVEALPKGPKFHGLTLDSLLNKIKFNQKRYEEVRDLLH
ncbi:MAG: ORF1 protein [Hibiscus virus X]